jgi:hypothetical protein
MTIGPLLKFNSAPGNSAYGRPRSFSEVSALKPIRELFSERSGGKFGPKMAGDRSLSKGGKRPNRTAGSNPLSSSNEAVRTAGQWTFLPRETISRLECAIQRPLGFYSAAGSRRSINSP